MQSWTMCNRCGKHIEPSRSTGFCIDLMTLTPAGKKRTKDKRSITLCSRCFATVLDYVEGGVIQNNNRKEE